MKIPFEDFLLRKCHLYTIPNNYPSPDQVGIFIGDFACLQDINLENFFTEYLIFMHGTIFLGVWCDSQVWHTLLFNVQCSKNIGDLPGI